MRDDGLISRNSQVPLYVQLADTIREQIRTGQIKKGDKLPSETEMIKYYRLGRLTVRDALAVLVNEGLLEKQHGKGTFCKSSLVAKNYRVDIFLNLSEIYFTPYYLRSICSVLEDENVNIVMSDTKNDDAVISALLDKAVSEGSNGVIFQPANTTDTASENLILMLDRLTQARIPYIMIDTYYKNASPSYVVMDEIQTGRIAADYLVRLGHSRMCAVRERDRIDSCRRIEGFRGGLPSEPYIIDYDDNIYESVKDIIENHPEVTGMFCFNDGIAKKCYEILAELNVSIPDRISVVSVDDTIIASTISPSLTSVIHPKEYLGKAAAKAMLSMISGEILWPYQKVFSPSLAIRKSCREI